MATRSQARRPKGTPSGGQYAADERPEADTVLDDDIGRGFGPEMSTALAEVDDMWLRIDTIRVATNVVDSPETYEMARLIELELGRIGRRVDLEAYSELWKIRAELRSTGLPEAEVPGMSARLAECENEARSYSYDDAAAILATEKAWRCEYAAKASEVLSEIRPFRDPVPSTGSLTARRSPL